MADLNTTSSSTQQPGKYAFYQQSSALCHLAGTMNYRRLQTMKARQVEQIKDSSMPRPPLMQNSDYKTKRTYWGEMTMPALAWAKARQNLRAKKGAYYKYLVNLKNNGLYHSNLFIDREGKQPLFKPKNPIDKMFIRSHTPTNILDKSTDKDQNYVGQIVLPISYEADSTEKEEGTVETTTISVTTVNFYNFDEGEFQATQPQHPFKICVEYDSSNQILTTYTLNHTDDSYPCNYIQGLGLPASIVEKYKQLNMDKHLYIPLNFRMNGFDGYKIIFDHIPYDSELEAEFYDMSLYQLMLFALGIDYKNQLITEGNPLFAAYVELHTEMQADPLNPWSYEEFSKENFLQYQIAQILKNDAELKEEVKNSMSFYIDYWKYYELIKTYYTENGDPAKLDYLLSEELALAYYFTNALFTLLVASASEDGLWGVWDLDEEDIEAAKEAAQAGKPMLPDGKTYRSLAVETNNGAFIKTWKKIKTKLEETTDNKEDWISFSGHGNLITFNPELQELQNAGSAVPEDGLPILKELGFACIDSYYSKELKPFYKKSSSTRTVVEGEITSITKD